MPFFEKELSREDHYRGRIVTVHTDTVQLDDGTTAFREIVDHPGGVGIVAVDAEGGVFMVRQYRYAMGKELLEIPAGKLEKGEDPYECAVRELGEETGCTAGKIVPLGTLYPSPGYTREVLYIYLALDLREGESHPDEGEFLDVLRMPLDKLCDMAENGEISDAKSVIGLLRARKYLNK